MASLNRLSPRTAATIATPGRHSDGGGLYLAVSPAGARSWVFLYRHGGRRKEMGLGPFSAVSLAQARQLAATVRAQLAGGLDPLIARKTQRAVAKQVTFGEAAAALVASMGPTWRNAKHRAQWEMTLRVYAAKLAQEPVGSVTTEHVLHALQPLWQAKPETASRTRGRIERVLDFAKARGWRAGENPARWRGHLDALLPKPAKLRRGHHKALPFADVPTFVGHLRTMDGIAAGALELCILTAARSGEILGARWSEIDFDAALWTVPASRMKGAREHRVPLSRRALEIVRDMESVRRGDFIFPGLKPNAPLSNMALEMVLRRMKVDATVHGFRSAFRDWCGDATHFPREVAEAALAHAQGSAVERAYRRSDALEKRRQLMDAWASHCEPKAANVVSFVPRLA